MYNENQHEAHIQNEKAPFAIGSSKPHCPVTHGNDRTSMKHANCQAKP